MATLAAARPLPMTTGWTRRDWLVAGGTGALFGWVLIGWGFLSQYFLVTLNSGFTVLGWTYFGWFLPGLVGMAVIRKPGACLVVETLAGVFEAVFILTLLNGLTPVTTCSFAGAALYAVSGLVQGLGGELGFIARRYRLGPATFALAGALAWWFGWVKGVYQTGCYSWSEPGILFTATASTVLVGLLLGALTRRGAPAGA